VLTHASGDAHPVRGSARHRPRVRSRRRRPPRAAPIASSSCRRPDQFTQLLKLSGIGPAAELRTHDISRHPRFARRGETCRNHLESISGGLQGTDHVVFVHQSLESRPDRRAAGCCARTDWAASNHFETCGFIRSRPGVPYPDIQYHFLPMAVATTARRWRRSMAIQAHVGPSAQERGWVDWRPTNPLDKPRILFNYLSEPDDWTEMRACVRLTREIFAQPAFRSISRPRDSGRAPKCKPTQRSMLHPPKVESAYHRHALARWAARKTPGSG